MSQTNTVLSEDERGLVNDCASRLRVIQGDTAAIDAEKRCEYLNEEINRSFKGLTPGRRKPCLEGLLARFPVAGQLANGQAAPPVPTVPVAPVADSPAKLLERLVALAGELSEEQRVEFARRLSDAGFVCANQESVPLEITREMQTRFGLAAGQQPRLERVVQLASLLAQSLYELDRTADRTSGAFSTMVMSFSFVGPLVCLYHFR